LLLEARLPFGGALHITYELAQRTLSGDVAVGMEEAQELYEVHEHSDVGVRLHLLVLTIAKAERWTTAAIVIVVLLLPRCVPLLAAGTEEEETKRLSQLHEMTSSHEPQHLRVETRW
jgi:hypothetical protein